MGHGPITPTWLLGLGQVKAVGVKQYSGYNAARTMVSLYVGCHNATADHDCLHKS